MNRLAAGRALYLHERRRKWQRGGADLRRHKELFIKERPAGMTARDALRHWEHIFAGYRDSPYAAHWVATAMKVRYGVHPR